MSKSSLFALAAQLNLNYTDHLISIAEGSWWNIRRCWLRITTSLVNRASLLRWITAIDSPVITSVTTLKRDCVVTGVSSWCLVFRGDFWSINRWRPGQQYGLLETLDRHKSEPNFPRGHYKRQASQNELSSDKANTLLSLGQIVLSGVFTLALPQHWAPVYHSENWGVCSR